MVAAPAPRLLPRVAAVAAFALAARAVDPWVAEYDASVIRAATEPERVDADSPEGLSRLANLSSLAAEYHAAALLADAHPPDSPETQTSDPQRRCHLRGPQSASSACAYPCKLNNGCECDHSKPHLDLGDGQFYGTCAKCRPGWHGWECNVPKVTCNNGGRQINATACACAPGFTGRGCMERQCLNQLSRPHSKPVPFVGPPLSHTNVCDCPRGTAGETCAVCTTPNATCSSLGGKCNVGILPQSDAPLHYSCNVTSKAIAMMFSGGKPVTVGVQAFIDKPDPFGTKANGTLSLSVFRNNLHSHWNQEWMTCTATQCEWDVKTVYTPAVVDTPAGAAIFARHALSISLLVVLFAFPLLALPHRADRLRRLAWKPLAATVVLLWIALVAVGAAAGHETLAPAGESQRSTYLCKQSSCRCGSYNRTAPPPHCANSMARPFLDAMHGKVAVHCDLQTGVCAVEMADLVMLPMMVATCKASSCVPPGAPRRQAAVTPLPDVPADSGFAVYAIGCFFAVLLVGLLSHLGLTLFRRRRLRNEYQAIVDADAGDAEDETEFTLVDGSFKFPAPRGLLSCLGAASPRGDDGDAPLLPNGQAKESGWQFVLRDINLTVRSGEMVALMGCSGAGKTTLLDILAANNKSGVVGGELHINGQPIGAGQRQAFKSMTGFVPQQDVLMPSLTVRQAVRHSARLKLPAPLGDGPLDELVDDVLESLQLTSVAGSVIGSPLSGTNRGISGGERRRVSIAMELIAHPRILLLDEPTSGLDAMNAILVMEAIAAIARRPPASAVYRGLFKYRPMVIFSIHQPSADVFGRFDKVIVLAKGSVVYAGPAAQALAHTSRVLGVPPPAHSEHNPAEALLRLHHGVPESSMQALRLCPSPVAVDVGVSGIQDVEPEEGGMRWVLDRTVENRRFYPDVWAQLRILSHRTFDALMGSYYLVASHAAVSLCMAVLLACLYREEPLTLDGTVDKAGMLMFVLLIISFSSLSVLDLFIGERALFAVEHENGYYGPVPYFVSKILFDFVPLRIIPTGIFAAVAYFPMGLRDDTGAPFLWFVGILVGFSLFSTVVCLCVGMVAPSFGVGALFGSLLILWQALFGGLLVQSETIPQYLRPFKYVSSFRFAFESIMVNELEGRNGCTVQVDNAHGQPKGSPIPIRCEQYLYHLGVNPNNFAVSVVSLGGGCAAATVLALVLLTFAVRYKR